MSKILLAGAWSGEFGWELCAWQGFIRNIAHNFDEVHIVSREGHDFLYRDFITKYHQHKPIRNGDAYMGEASQERMNEVIKEVNPTHHIKPFNVGYIGTPVAHVINPKFHQQKFIKYESNVLDYGYDIILHGRNKSAGSFRNWDKEKWEELIIKLKKEGYTMCTIGTDDALSFDDVDDYRNISIEETVSLLNRTKLVVGQSSGAMHLAALSGAPHLVWSDHTNRPRYMYDWNPLKTPIYFFDEEGWNPSVDFIYEKIKEIV